jgi:hypothetical protein
MSLPDQPGRSTVDTLLRFVRDRQMLVVLDNCEHLLDACAELVVALLGGAALKPDSTRPSPTHPRRVQHGRRRGVIRALGHGDDR